MGCPPHESELKNSLVMGEASEMAKTGSGAVGTVIAGTVPSRYRFNRIT
jgi:hypothetical protein